MPSKYDAIVVGAGHNGLTCACYLAKAGLKLLVLDQYHIVGGMSTTDADWLHFTTKLTQEQLSYLV